MLHAKTARLEMPDELPRWQRFVVNQIESNHPEMAAFVWFDRTAPGPGVQAVRDRRGATEADICNAAPPAMPVDPGPNATDAAKSEYFSREKIYRSARSDQVNALSRFRACKGFILGTIGSMMLAKLESVDAFNDAINEHNLVKLWRAIIATASPGGSAGNYAQASRLIEFFALKQGDTEPLTDFVARYHDAKEKCGGNLNLETPIEAMVMANMLSGRYLNLQNFVRNRTDPVATVEAFKQILLSWTDQAPGIDTVAAATIAAGAVASGTARPKKKQRDTDKLDTGQTRRSSGCFACQQHGHAARDCPFIRAVREQQHLPPVHASASASTKKVESISLSYDT